MLNVCFIVCFEICLCFICCFVELGFGMCVLWWDFVFCVLILLVLVVFWLIWLCVYCGCVAFKCGFMFYKFVIRCWLGCWFSGGLHLLLILLIWLGFWVI